MRPSCHIDCRAKSTFGRPFIYLLACAFVFILTTYYVRAVSTISGSLMGEEATWVLFLFGRQRNERKQRELLPDRLSWRNFPVSTRLFWPLAHLAQFYRISLINILFIFQFPEVKEKQFPHRLHIPSNRSTKDLPWIPSRPNYTSRAQYKYLQSELLEHVTFSH